MTSKLIKRHKRSRPLGGDVLDNGIQKKKKVDGIMLYYSEGGKKYPSGCFSSFSSSNLYNVILSPLGFFSSFFFWVGYGPSLISFVWVFFFVCVSDDMIHRRRRDCVCVCVRVVAP